MAFIQQHPCLKCTLIWLTVLLSSFTEVPDYLEFISQPMDFSTMRTKLEGHAYCSISDLEKDFDLVISNCLKYNSKDTMFHKAALQLREVGGAILRHAQRQFQSIGLDPGTGMHLPDTLNKHGFYHCTWDDGELRVGTRHLLVNTTFAAHPLLCICFSCNLYSRFSIRPRKQTALNH